MTEYVLMKVKGMQALFDAMDRAESKGYMPDAIQDAWAGFDVRPAPSASIADTAGAKVDNEIQAEIHQRIAPLLTKRDQGRVMGEVRAVLASSSIDRPGAKAVASEPTPEMLDVAVSFALNVQISRDYNWSAYMADVYRRMIAAAPVAKPVAWHVGNADGTMNELGALYHHESSAIDHIASYKGTLDARVIPLYAAPVDKDSK